MTALRDYQTTIALNTLYITRAIGGTEQLQPTIEVIGGTVDIYGSQVTPESAPTGMYKTATNFSGMTVFAAVPNYFYVTQNTGTTTSIVLSGIEIEIA